MKRHSFSFLTKNQISMTLTVLDNLYNRENKPSSKRNIPSWKPRDEETFLILQSLGFFNPANDVNVILGRQTKTV